MNSLDLGYVLIKRKRVRKATARPLQTARNPCRSIESPTHPSTTQPPSCSGNALRCCASGTRTPSAPTRTGRLSRLDRAARPNLRRRWESICTLLATSRGRARRRAANATVGNCSYSTHGAGQDDAPLISAAASERRSPMEPSASNIEIRASDVTLHGSLGLPDGAVGLVVFAHGSGSVPGATHLFEERGALEQVAAEARDWYRTHFGAGG